MAHPMGEREETRTNQRLFNPRRIVTIQRELGFILLPDPFRLRIITNEFKHIGNIAAVAALYFDAIAVIDTIGYAARL